ncbi:MAG: hypothetical protein ACLU6Y_06830 [Ruminococcus sp.]
MSDGGQVEKSDHRGAGDRRRLAGTGILVNYPWGNCSGFCIARALGKETRFLIADEISTMLDLITQSQIWNFLLDEVKRREIGLIVVSS